MSGPWTLDEALALIAVVQPELLKVKAYCGLTGSVLFKGSSLKDVDIIVYPHSTEEPTPFVDIASALKAAGLQLVFPWDYVREYWRSKGIKTRRRVEIWRTRKTHKRVDIMYMGWKRSK